MTSRDDEHAGTYYDIERLSSVIGIPMSDPTDLYAQQQASSIAAGERVLNIRVRSTPDPRDRTSPKRRWKS